MADIEKRLSELLHELPQKREDFEELQQRYNSELLNQRELKNEIETLKTEVKSLTTQLEFTNKALHKCEDNFSVSRESAVKHRLSLEVSNKTIDAMKEQATKLHLENVNLKKQVDMLERDLKAESFFRDSCTAKQTKTLATIEALTSQMCNLEKDYRDIERQANEAISIGRKSELLLEHKDTATAQLQNKVEELTAKVATLKSERVALEETLKERKPTEQHYVKEILQEWQTAVDEMKMRPANYEKELEALQQALQNAIDAKSAFQRLEAASNERIRDLEEKLANAKKVEKKKNIDCNVQTDLNFSIDAACETSPLEVEHVYTQTNVDPKEVDQETPISTLQEKIVETDPSASKCVYSFAAANTSLFSSSSLGELMSRFQKEKDHTNSLQDLTYIMQTQVNTNLPDT